MEYLEGLFFVLSIVGTFVTAIGIISGIWAVTLWLRGILPVLVRLGQGLSGRKIALLAKGDAADSLVALLEDSSLIKKRNIVKVSGVHDIGRIQDCSIFLLNWDDWGDNLLGVLDKKSDSQALLVLAEAGGPKIDEESMVLLRNHRNTSVCNFRGRLMSDMVLAMVTTAYDKS